MKLEGLPAAGPDVDQRAHYWGALQLQPNVEQRVVVEADPCRNDHDDVERKL